MKIKRCLLHQTQKDCKDAMEGMIVVHISDSFNILTRWEKRLHSQLLPLSHHPIGYLKPLDGEPDSKKQTTFLKSTSNTSLDPTAIPTSHLGQQTRCKAGTVVKPSGCTLQVRGSEGASPAQPTPPTCPAASRGLGCRSSARQGRTAPHAARWPEVTQGES